MGLGLGLGLGIGPASRLRGGVAAEVDARHALEDQHGAIPLRDQLVEQHDGRVGLQVRVRVKVSVRVRVRVRVLGWASMSAESLLWIEASCSASSASKHAKRSSAPAFRPPWNTSLIATSSPPGV